MLNVLLKFNLRILLTVLSSSVALATADYQGSSFNEVWDVINNRGFIPVSQKEKEEYSQYLNGGFPQYSVSASSVFSGGKEPLRRDAVRTVNERFDYYDRLPKRLHPNGVCVSGTWEINSKTTYSGMLATQAKGLIIGRISVAMEDTEHPNKRGFGFAGKVFPTEDSNRVVSTGNFFTVDVLMGEKTKHVLGAATTNEPETGFTFSLIGLGLKIGSVLKSADENPGFRPLTQIAAAGTIQGQAVSQPKWIRVKAIDVSLSNDEKDFRAEVLKGMEDNHQIQYSIEVSDKTADRNASSGWTRIGTMSFTQALVSYGCDRRLHFSHPKLK